MTNLQKYCPIAPGFALGLLLLIGILSGASATDFTWEGVNYRDVKVIKVDGDQVVLESKKQERITVPRDRIVGFLKTDLKAFEERKKAGRGDEIDEELKRPAFVDPNTFERAWIYGTASDGSRDGFFVASSDLALPRGKTNRDGESREPKKTKGGAPVYNGIVFVRRLSAGENTQFDRVLWRDGWFEKYNQKFPAFSSSKPVIKVPVFGGGSRDWTNAEGKKMTAALKQVKEGKAQFLSAKGKLFVYDLEKLSEDDQEFVRGAQERYEKKMKQFKKDHPWVNVE